MVDEAGKAERLLGVGRGIVKDSSRWEVAPGAARAHPCIPELGRT